MCSIEIKSRDGNIWSFNEIDDHTYHVKFGDLPVTIHYDANGVDENTGYFDRPIWGVDPSGGPMFVVGSKLTENLIIKEIQWYDGFDFIVTEIK